MKPLNIKVDRYPILNQRGCIWAGIVDKSVFEVHYQPDPSKDEFESMACACSVRKIPFMRECDDDILVSYKARISKRELPDGDIWLFLLPVTNEIPRTVFDPTTMRTTRIEWLNEITMDLIRTVRGRETGLQILFRRKKELKEMEATR